MAKTLRMKAKYQSEVVPALMKDFGYKNKMQVPKLEKIVVNMGMGEAISNAKLIDSAVEQVTAITGQKPVGMRTPSLTMMPMSSASAAGRSPDTPIAVASEGTSESKG